MHPENSDLYTGPDWLKKEQINYKTWALKPIENPNNLYQPKYHINYIIIILHNKRLRRDVVIMYCYMCAKWGHTAFHHH